MKVQRIRNPFFNVYEMLLNPPKGFIREYIVSFTSILTMPVRLYERIFERVDYHHQWLQQFVEAYMNEFIGFINR